MSAVDLLFNHSDAEEDALRLVAHPMTEALVSIALVTYNHVDFIAKAIDSVLAQECLFKTEIVIGDDCSNDGASEILQTYAERFPGKIRLLERSENIGIQRNIRDTLNACRGEFIAYLDGDDFWTDPFKLQRQVEQLLENPDCKLSFHDATLVYDHCRPGILRPPGVATRFGMSDILQKNFIAAQSAVFRREAIEWLPLWLLDEPTVPWDWPFFIECAKRGELLYLQGEMCAYRVHPQGTWTAQTTRKRVEALSRMLQRESRDLPWYYRIVALKTRLLLLLKREMSLVTPLLLDRLVRMRHAYFGY